MKSLIKYLAVFVVALILIWGKPNKDTFKNVANMKQTITTAYNEVVELPKSVKKELKSWNQIIHFIDNLPVK